MIEYLILVFAIPLGVLLSKITKHEKEIYSKSPYFPIIIPTLGFLSIIFIFLDKQIALTLIFIFLTTLVWQKA